MLCSACSSRYSTAIQIIFDCQYFMIFDSTYKAVWRSPVRFLFFPLFVQTTSVLSSIEIKYFGNHNQIVQFTFIKSNTQQSRAITSIKSNAPINHLHKTKRRHYVNLWHTLGSGFRKDP